MTSDFSSGVRYMWCGSLPVGILRVSFQLTGSITLTLASSEFKTKIGFAAAKVLQGAKATQHRVNKAAQRAEKRVRKRGRNVTTIHFLIRAQV